MIDSIISALMLMESLDTQHKIDRIYHKEMPEEDSKHGITDHKEYELDNGDAGHLTIWKRKGAYEIHHNLKDISGKWMPSGKTNSKFVGTMFAVGSRILKSGNPLRIVGRVDNGMFKHYHRLANVLAKRHGYHVSHPKPYNYDDPEAKHYNEITVAKPEGNPAIVESLHTRMRVRNKSNNYDLDTYKDSKSFATIDEMMDDYFNINQGNQ